MPNLTPKFFITGATGSQGGAVARSLLAHNYQVNALVRNPDGTTAQQLARLGARLIKGDYEDAVAVAQAAEGCRGLFLNTMPTKPSELEVQQARNLIQAAKTAGAKTVVYSSSARVEEHTSFPDWDPNGMRAGYIRAKTSIQDLVRAAGFEKWTILQPAWIMTKWIAPSSAFFWPDLKQRNIMVSAFGRATKVHLTDPDDIGSFATKSFTTEHNLAGEIVRIAGDELNISQIAEVMSEVSGVCIGVEYRPEEEIQDLKGKHPIVAAENWQNLSGTQVDLKRVSDYGVQVTSFKGFLQKHTGALVAALEG